MGGIIIIITSCPSTCNLAARGTRLRGRGGRLTDMSSFPATSSISCLLSSMSSGCQPPRTKGDFSGHGGCTRDADINRPVFNCCWSLMKIWYCPAWPVFHCRDSERIHPEDYAGLGRDGSPMDGNTAGTRSRRQRRMSWHFSTCDLRRPL